ncbi:hypothetical protein BHYA_0280g00060 [Botrytis hyacinthi]|uniref:Uncharacterized protein n=1 Tax=Botrytis hyacinthi TaxID=278943 RepID=A0A4Z1GG91_9HELO|nr:hypothetical protein BHYA_0280g00060 [Botrytis hyacinthi]
MVRDESENREGHVDASVDLWLEPFTGSILKKFSCDDAMLQDKWWRELTHSGNGNFMNVMLQLSSGYIRVGEGGIAVNALSTL